MMLNYNLFYMVLQTCLISVDLSSESQYYEYCRVLDSGERRQECRLLMDQDMIFHSKYEAKRQATLGNASISSASEENTTSSHPSNYVATSSGAGPDTSGDAAARAAGSNVSLAGGLPLVASDVMVIGDSRPEIRNNSVPAGEEEMTDQFRRLRDMVNNKTPRQNDSVPDGDDDDHEFDDLFNRFELMNNTTLKQNNITKYEEDHHQYYNSSFIVSEAVGHKYWVTMSQRENVQLNEVLSNAHRRAVTVRLMFDFPFYGHLIRNVTVATGGFLFTGEYVHAWLAATQYVAPLMANFDTGLSNRSAIKYVDDGTSFTVEWQNVILKDEPHFGEFTFQVTLHSNGDIVFVYKQVPVIIENIRDRLHPVKVGLSDAYISDRTIFFMRRKTIYEYHRVDFNKEDIRNWTVIYLSALPTCVSKATCSECLDQVPGFQCNWCEAVSRCSSGMDRHRKDWLTSGCDKSSHNSLHMCPSMQHQQQQQQQTLAEQYDSSNVPGILSVILLLGVAGSLALWMLYAYRNPHTASGQFLIRNRPSQWRWRRGEARYTAATIHM